MICRQVGRFDPTYQTNQSFVEIRVTFFSYYALQNFVQRVFLSRYNYICKVLDQRRYQRVYPALRVLIALPSAFISSLLSLLPKQ
jgi:hypothetical protein